MKVKVGSLFPRDGHCMERRGGRSLSSDPSTTGEAKLCPAPAHLNSIGQLREQGHRGWIPTPRGHTEQSSVSPPRPDPTQHHPCPRPALRRAERISGILTALRLCSTEKEPPSYGSPRGLQGRPGPSRSHGRRWVSSALTPATVMPAGLRGSLERGKLLNGEFTKFSPARYECGISSVHH